MISLLAKTALVALVLFFGMALLARTTRFRVFRGVVRSLFLLSIWTAAVAMFLPHIVAQYRTAARNANIEVSLIDAEYFAIQTLTTVGYGSRITAFDMAKEPDLDPLKSLASKAMLLSSVLWALLISSVFTLASEIQKSVRLLVRAP